MLGPGAVYLREIVELRVGSHLYGTATPLSDTDTKAVHLPSARDILLQRARPAITSERAFAEQLQHRPLKANAHGTLIPRHQATFPYYQ